MLTLTGMFKSIFSLRLGANRLSANHRQIASRTVTAVDMAADKDRNKDEQQFLASIAGLSPEQRQQRIAKREWYRRLVERQARIEVEHSVAHQG